MPIFETEHDSYFNHWVSGFCFSQFSTYRKTHQNMLLQYILPLGLTYLKNDYESCISILPSINWWIFINFGIFTAWNEFPGKEPQFITQNLEEIKVLIYKSSTCSPSDIKLVVVCGAMCEKSLHVECCCLRSSIWPCAETPPWKSTGQQTERDNWCQIPLTPRIPVQSDQEISKHVRKHCYVSTFSGHWTVWSLKRFALLQKAALLNPLPKRIKMQSVVANHHWTLTEKLVDAPTSAFLVKSDPSLQPWTVRHLPSFHSHKSFPHVLRQFPAYKATHPCGWSLHSIPPQCQTAECLVSKNELCCKQHCDNLIICQSIDRASYYEVYFGVQR